MGSEPYPGTQAVLRAIALLKAFTDEHPEWGLTDLARFVGLNKTTVYRLLTALESEGLVSRKEDTEGYKLGPEIIVLGGRAMRSNDLRTAARLQLEALAQTTGEHATLEVLSDNQALILDDVPSKYVVGSRQEIGSYWPLHATSTGKVLLANLPLPDLEKFLKNPLHELTPKTNVNPDRLHKELAQIREQEYAVCLGELESGLVGIASPIRDFQGKTIAAISVDGPSTRLNQARILEFVEIVMESAEIISTSIGFKPSES